MKKANKHLGSSFDDFLKEEGIYEHVKIQGEKKFLVFQIIDQMKRQGLTKVDMAKRMKTSRSELARILDPDNQAVSLESLQRAAAALGKSISINLVDASRRKVAG
jgi:antitoxin HicB